MSHSTIPIRGMHCASCELLVEEQLKKIPGVATVKVFQKRGMAEITYQGKEPEQDQIIKAVQEAGYEVGQKEKAPWISRRAADYKDLVYAAFIILVLYLLAQRFGLFNLSVNASSSGIAVALLVGLVAGVSTCMALVGGFVLGLSSRHS